MKTIYIHSDGSRHNTERFSLLSGCPDSLPNTPGVYIFRDRNWRILYVGKAVNLKNRVKSYFQNLDLLSPKTKVMIGKIDQINHIPVNNELEALLLEAELIKRHRPSYNISLKDNKSYKFIKIEKTRLRKDQENPNGVFIYKILTTHKKSQDKAVYLGPYPEAGSVSIILKTMRKIFPYRDCSTAKFNRYKKAKRPCLYGHIGVCPAPCLPAQPGQSDQAIQINNENINTIKKYLTGDKKKLFRHLKSEMKKLSRKLEYEKASIIRDQLIGYENLTQNKIDIKEYISSPDLVGEKARHSVELIKKVLEEKAGFKFKNQKINSFRLETYDISNIQGKNAVGSMIVFTGGKSDKREYRRFTIKFKDTTDDPAMIKEMLSRRFKRRPSDSSWKKPDLIIIDGGSAQLSSALDILGKYKLKIPAAGLAKKNEEIIIKKENRFHSIKLDKNNPGLMLIIQARDEAHRFAINYFRKLHKKELIN